MFRTVQAAQRWTRFCFLLIVSSLLSPRDFAQLRPPQGPLEHPFDASARQLLYETINFPSGTSGLSRIDLLYRVDLAFFIAVRNSEGIGRQEFLRHGEVVAELIDSLGISQARDSEVFADETQASESIPGVREWHRGMMSFNVRPGIYTLEISITDQESDRRISERRRTARAVVFPENQPIASPPFLVLWSDTTTAPEKVLPQDLDGGAKFGESSAWVMNLTNFGSLDSVRLEYSVARTETTQATRLQNSDSTFTQARILRDVQLHPAGSHEAAYLLTPSGTGDAVVIVPFHSEKLALHEYMLKMTVSTGSFSRDFSTRFGMVWPEMPPPLRSFEYAFDALRYITSKREFDSLDRGSDAERRGKFEAFWAARDRTRQTAYNEVMTEYYTRVYHAGTTFSTLRQDDGSKSDRGRIYILYGPPASTERKLDPTGYIEIWFYPKLSKKFLFLDEAKTGDYHLTSTQPL